MIVAIRTTLTTAGVAEPLHRVAADSGYWSIANVSTIPGAPELLIPPAHHGRHGKPRKDGRPSESRSNSLRAAMRAKLDHGPGKVWYAQRSRTIEPVFGQIKTVQGGTRFMRRGLGACQAEWQLLCGTHNLLKLWRLAVASSAMRGGPGRVMLRMGVNRMALWEVIAMVTAYVLIQTEVGKAGEVAKAVLDVEGVHSAEGVTGPYDVIALTEARNVDELGKLVVAGIQVIRGITRTLTCPVVHLEPA